MKKFFVAVLLVVITLSLSPVAMAHPGRTDARGGHYDDFTKKYHYHHGYSQHQHTDIDGDGILDCPLDKNWGSSHPEKINNVSENKEADQKRITFWDILNVAFVLVAVAFFVFWMIYVPLSVLFKK